MVLVRTGLVWAASYSLVLVRIGQKHLENLTYHIWGIQLLSFHLGERGFHWNANICKQREGRLCKCEHLLPIKLFLSKYLVHKLLAIINRFFVGFLKTFALLKISVLGNYISFLFFFAWSVINPDCWLLNSL